MFQKHKILCLIKKRAEMAGQLRILFLEPLPFHMLASAARDLSNNGLSYKQLVELFDAAFSPDFETRLVGGQQEPLYQPAVKETFSVIYFRENYPSSALHEVAHWCIASRARREQVDYGYWYEPDGRSEQQQREFEKVEVNPQALEWIFSLAAGIRFNISVDNLRANVQQSEAFTESVARQAQAYIRVGLPDRANRYYRALLAASQRCEVGLDDFSLNGF